MNNRNFSKAVEAVSPVVATLLLVLVAAGAAIGFGVFLNNFQKKTQNNVSSDTPQETIHIGGSSTVFELTEKALPAWKAAHPSIAIDDQEGGSDAGLYAICHGTVDIGTSSKIFPATGSGITLANCPDLNGDGVKDAASDMHITVVGYDGVAMVWNVASGHCSAMSFNSAQVRELYNVNGRKTTPARGSDSKGDAAINGTGSSPYNWQDLADAGLCTPAGSQNGTAAMLKTVQVGARSDNSGTEDGFCNKVLGLKKDGINCSNDASDQLVDTLYDGVKSQQGNDGIATFLDQTPDALSFIGFGSVATDSNLKAAKINGLAPDVNGIKAAGNDAALLKQDKACDTSVYTVSSPTTEYCAVRPLQYITAGSPSATEQLFLDFMLQTLNNVNFNKAAGYVSIYS